MKNSRPQTSNSASRFLLTLKLLRGRIRRRIAGTFSDQRAYSR